MPILDAEPAARTLWRRGGPPERLMVAYLWEFEVKAPERAAFEAEYGPQGAWAKLFAGAPGFLGTQLHRDLAAPLRYLTIDRWDSVASHEAFRLQQERRYQELDRQCERFTAREEFLGQFSDATPRSGP